MKRTKRNTTKRKECRMMKIRQCVIQKQWIKIMDSVIETKGLFICTNSKHDKSIHSECFKELVRMEYTNKPLVCMKDGKQVAISICGKQCYKNYNRVLKQKDI